MAEREFMSFNRLRVDDEAEIKGLTVGGDPKNGTAGVPLGTLADRIDGFSFTPAAGAANVCEVTIQPLDAAGNALTGVRNLEVWLSDAATGAGITGTTASGTVQQKSGEGTLLSALTAKKHLVVQSKAAGSFVLEITDTSKTLFYVCARVPSTGSPAVSAQLVAGDYGA